MHVLAMGDQTFLGRWAIVVFVRDCPFIVVLNAPFRPLGPPYVFGCAAFALFLFVLTFLVVISILYKVDVRLPQWLPT